MTKGKKYSLPFDKRGGLIAIRRPLIESDAYKSLSAHAKCLLILMQVQWRNEKAVDYGIREAMVKIPCSHATAIKAFDQLQDRGFIVMVEPSIFNSRTQSKARTWRLTSMPFKDGVPTNNWEKWRPEK